MGEIRFGDTSQLNLSIEVEASRSRVGIRSPRPRKLSVGRKNGSARDTRGQMGHGKAPDIEGILNLSRSANPPQLPQR